MLPQDPLRKLRSALNQERYYPIYLCALASVIFLTGLGWRDFWSPVEPRYAEISRIMWLKNEWIVLNVNGELYVDKPILYFWLALIFAKITGTVNEWTVRLPAALGAIGMVLATYRIGSDFYNPRVGLFAGAVLATSARVIWEARWAHLDALFAFFFTLSMYFAAQATLRPERRREFLWAYPCMALATLTKGLIGVVLPGLILLSFVLLTRNWQLIREARLGSGILIFLAIAAPWFILVSLATDGRWFAEFFYIHHLQRFTRGVAHVEPFYYYLKTLPRDFIPWTLFLVPALLGAKLDLGILRRPQALFFLLWFAVVYFFFSAADTKRDLYLLPLFPMLALFVANYIDNLARDAVQGKTMFRRVLGYTFAALALLSCATPFVARTMFPEAFYPSLPFVLVLAAGSFWVVHTARRGSPQAACTVICITMAASFIAAVFALWPYIDRFKSPRPIADELSRRLGRSTPLYLYLDATHDYNFYMARETIPVIKSAAELTALRLQAADGYLLVNDRYLREVGDGRREEVVIGRRAARRRWYLMPLKQPSR